MEHWPHSPPHWTANQGTYMVTAGTYRKLHHFRCPERLTILQNNLISCANEFNWSLQAWAVFSNHYHFVASAPKDPQNLNIFINKLHGITARIVNERDGTPGRQVWHQFWDTRLTFERSYLARLNYVKQNPVRHKLVENAAEYTWCSANWFQKTASRAFQKTVESFKIDNVNVYDDF